MTKTMSAAAKTFAFKLRKFPPEYHILTWRTAWHTSTKTVWCPDGSQYPTDGWVIVQHVRVTEYYGLDKNGQRRLEPEVNEFTSTNITNTFDKKPRPSALAQLIRYLQLKKHDYIELMYKKDGKHKFLP